MHLARLLRCVTLSLIAVEGSGFAPDAQVQRGAIRGTVVRTSGRMTSATRVIDRVRSRRR